jgi:hypothetical protein
MRNHIKAITLLAAFAGVTACSDDFLSEVPSDFVAPENFYRNQADAIGICDLHRSSITTFQSDLPRP